MPRKILLILIPPAVAHPQGTSPFLSKPRNQSVRRLPKPISRLSMVVADEVSWVCLAYIYTGHPTEPTSRRRLSIDLVRQWVCSWHRPSCTCRAGIGTHTGSVVYYKRRLGPEQGRDWKGCRGRRQPGYVDRRGCWVYA